MTDGKSEAQKSSNFPQGHREVQSKFDPRFCVFKFLSTILYPSLYIYLPYHPLAYNINVGIRNLRLNHTHQKDLIYMPAAVLISLIKLKDNLCPSFIFGHRCIWETAHYCLHKCVTSFYTISTLFFLMWKTWLHVDMDSNT